LTLVQLIRIHKKINNVVKRTKNNEIPSIPMLKFKFKKGIHNTLFTNWKEPIDLLKKTHKNKEIMYTLHEVFKATAFNIDELEDGMSNNIKVPNKGTSKIKRSKFVGFNNKTSNIHIL